MLTSFLPVIVQRQLCFKNTSSIPEKATDNYFVKVSFRLSCSRGMCTSLARSASPDLSVAPGFASLGSECARLWGVSVLISGLAFCLPEVCLCLSGVCLQLRPLLRAADLADAPAFRASPLGEPRDIPSQHSPGPTPRGVPTPAIGCTRQTPNVSYLASSPPILP